MIESLADYYERKKDEPHLGMRGLEIKDQETAELLNNPKVSCFINGLLHFCDLHASKKNRIQGYAIVKTTQGELMAIIESVPSSLLGHPVYGEMNEECEYEGN